MVMYTHTACTEERNNAELDQITDVYIVAAIRKSISEAEDT